MDQELISYLDKQFGGIDQRFAEFERRFDAVDKRFDKVEDRLAGLEKETHETRILMENLQDKVQLVAEGLAGVVESFKTHRTEVSQEIEGVRGLVQQSYSDLDHRVRKLEGRSTDH